MTLTYPNALNNPITTTCTIEPYEQQDNEVVYYHYSGWDEGEPLRTYNKYDIYLTGGQQFSFEIDSIWGQSGNDYYFELTFKVYKESYITNLYLNNIRWRYGGDSAYLKNVYFLGQSEYYEDNTSGYYTIWHDNSDGRDLYLDFDICLMNSSLVDGSAYQNGYNEGWNAGNDYGFEQGYDNGYTHGYQDAEINLDAQGSTALTIFTGIINVGLLPVNFFLNILNFEVFGINIGAIVTATMTVAIVIILIRIITGKKND